MSTMLVSRRSRIVASTLFMTTVLCGTTANTQQPCSCATPCAPCAECPTCPKHAFWFKSPTGLHGRNPSSGIACGTCKSCPPQGLHYGYFPTCWSKWPPGWPECPTMPWDQPAEAPAPEQVETAPSPWSAAVSVPATAPAPAAAPAPTSTPAPAMPTPVPAPLSSRATRKKNVEQPKDEQPRAERSHTDRSTSLIFKSLPPTPLEPHYTSNPIRYPQTSEPERIEIPQRPRLEGQPIPNTVRSASVNFVGAEAPTDGKDTAVQQTSAK